MKNTFLKKSVGLFLALAMLVSLFTCLMAVPASASGTTPDLVEFKGTDWTCMKYTKGWSTISAGDYRFEMDCKITSGVPCIQVGADETGGTLSAQSNYVETYDSVDYKYIITFTMTTSFEGNLGAMVGNYGTGNRKGDCTGNAVFACANPVLYKLDSDGNPTGSSLINTFAEDYYSTSRAGNKWNRRNFGSSTATCSSIPAHYFAREQDLVTFSHTNSYACLLYMKSWSTLPAGNYRFEMDCKAETGTPYVHINCRGSEEIAAMTDIVKTYDRVNYKYVLTFTLTSSWTEVLGVRVGSWNDYAGTDLRCAHPTLYLLDANGDPTGSSLINTFSEKYYASSGTPGNPSSERDVWFRAPSGITYSKIPADAFDPSGERMIRFPAVTPSYQVLTYKDSYLHLNTGTYRFTIDQYNASGSGTVNLWSGTNIGDVISKTSDQLIGNSRIVTFTLNSAITGFGIFIGNYSDNTADVYFKKPMLYKVENGVTTGFSLIKPINTQTLVLKAGLTRAGIESGKWSSINYQSGNITADYINNNLFNAPTFKSRSLTLKDDVSLNFTVNLSGLSAAQLSSCAMDFVIPNDKTYTQELSKAEDLDDGQYRFTCNLTSVQMAETVTPTLRYGSSSLTGETFSVRNYVDYIVANDHDTKLRKLVRAINDYGYYSQQYLSAQHSELTFTGASRIGSAYTSSDYSAASSAVSGKAMTKSITGSAVSKVQYNINFGSAISINVKLYKDQTITASASLDGINIITTDKGDYEEVRIFDLPISRLGETVTINGAGTSNKTGYTVTLSGLSYIRAILNSSSSTDAKNAVTALYDYYKAAIAYAG